MGLSRKPAKLTSVELEPHELEAIELEKGGHYLLALTLMREPTEAECNRVVTKLGKLCAELRRDRVKAHCVVLTPGERLQCFRLDRYQPKRRRRRRRDDDDDDEQV